MGFVVRALGPSTLVETCMIKIKGNIVAVGKMNIVIAVSCLQCSLGMSISFSRVAKAFVIETKFIRPTCPILT